MAEIAYSGTRRGGGGRWVLRGILVLLIVGVAVGFAKRAELAKLFEKPKPVERREGLVDLFVPAVRIPAYARIQLGMLKRISRSREAVEGRDFILDIKDIVYRVPILDLEPEAPFKEELLAPRGTRPGLSSGIPAGWAAVTLAEEEVDGQVTALHPGDEVAVLAVWSSKDMPSVLPAPSTWIARRARVLLPLRDRIINTTAQAAALGNRAGGRGQKVVHELTIAMPQEDLVAFGRAKGRARMQIILLSALDRDAKGAKGPPPRDPESPVWAVEVLQGTQRSVALPSWWRPPEDSHASKE